MKNKALLGAALVVLLLMLTSTVLSDELYITNQGTYLKRNSESFKESTFRPNAYYIKSGNMLYHLERQEWQFPQEKASDKGDKVRLSLTSNDLMIERVKIRDISKCVYTLDSLESFYSGKEKMKKWAKSQSVAAYHPNYKGEVKKLHNHAEIHPTYMGGEIISLLRVYDKYAGGAHGINGYELYTYTLSGKELKVKDLFEDWDKVKHALRFSMLKVWASGEVEISKQLYGKGKEDLKEKLITMTDMSGELMKILENELSEKGFVFTLSEEGIRFNLYFPRYSLGANPLGGSWISIPVKEMTEVVQNSLERWLDEKGLDRLPKELGYFSQKTQHYNIFPKPDKFEEEFIIGTQEVKGNLDCLGKLWDLLPSSE
ncbi:hypothetical protein KGY79_08875 [Candidatus Bipolaricaulota bacterium]|nr:hypothetical protein [Candidatus Bipolaricaulota bacterium]